MMLKVLLVIFLPFFVKVPEDPPSAAEAQNAAIMLGPPLGSDSYEAGYTA